MSISISDARKMGLVPNKNRKTPHHADVARAAGKQNTQMKAWAKIIKKGK
jgi:hypothetical protein